MSRVRRVRTSERATAVVAADVRWDRFPALWRGMLDDVYAVVRPQRSSRVRWTNVMLYRDGSPNVEVGVLMPGSFAPARRVVASTLPAGEAAMVVHRGPFERLGESHEALRAWCTARGEQPTGVVWEVYGHGDVEPARLETRLYHGLRPRAG